MHRRLERKRTCLSAGPSKPETDTAKRRSRQSISSPSGRRFTSIIQTSCSARRSTIIELNVERSCLTNGSDREKEFLQGLKSLCEDSAFFRFYMNIVNDRLRSLDDAQPLLGAPHPRQVVGGGGQGPFDGYFSKSSHAKPPHAALLLQHSVHRLDQRFASRVNFRARRVAQFPAHPPLRRMGGPLPQPPPTIQPPRHIRVGHIRIQVACFQGL